MLFFCIVQRRIDDYSSLEYKGDKRMLDPTQPLDYASSAVPSSYQCGACGVSNCKLWRDYMTRLDELTLWCCNCAAKDQDTHVGSMTEEGKYLGEQGTLTDCIGDLVPAIPVEPNNTYWGYSSVPPRGCAWWRNLPNRPGDPVRSQAPARKLQPFFHWLMALVPWN